MTAFKGLLTSLIVCFFALNAYATDTGVRGINAIGCHLNDSTCYVDIDGSAVGPTSCSSNSVRWSKDASVNGEETLSLLLAAFAAGKKVNFEITGACYGSFPTFSYITVYK